MRFGADLNFRNFSCVVVINQLQHANAQTILLNDLDVALLDARSEMPLMPRFVPGTPGGIEQISVRIAAQLIQPGAVFD